jgi:hypothetical protein
VANGYAMSADLAAPNYPSRMDLHRCWLCSSLYKVGFGRGAT